MLGSEEIYLLGMTILELLGIPKQELTEVEALTNTKMLNAAISVVLSD